MATGSSARSPAMAVSRVLLLRASRTLAAVPDVLQSRPKLSVALFSSRGMAATTLPWMSGRGVAARAIGCSILAWRVLHLAQMSTTALDTCLSSAITVVNIASKAEIVEARLSKGDMAVSW